MIDALTKVALGDFRFPSGDDLCDSLWAYAWGKVRPQLKNASNEIAAVGAPMSAIPGVSRFWTAATSNGTYLLTWENFAAGRVPIPARQGAVETANAQVELMRNGDFIARSNGVESVYRRVNPDDWDDDGIANEDDDEPLAPAEESEFGTEQRLSDETATLTAIKVEIEPVVTREGFPHRHRMGIREEFFARAYPEEASVVSVVSKDWVSVDGAKFECPIRAAVNGIRFDVSGTSYCPDLSVVEPIGIVCSGGFNRCVDGCIAMELQPYIAPLDVCFSRIRVMEVPTTQIGPSDYFTNSVFSSIWYHTTNRGAGVWHRPGRDNFFFNDIASFAEYCPPPIAEGNIDWLIPLAWAEDDATSIDDRIGIMANEYHQIFSLDAQGGLRIDKFSQWIKCSAEGYVTASPGIQK